MDVDNVNVCGDGSGYGPGKSLDDVTQSCTGG